MNDQRIITGALFALILSCFNLVGQRGRPYVADQKMSVREDQVIIEYNLQNTNPDNNHNIDLLFVDERYKLVSPDSLYFRKAGKDHTAISREIIWDIRNDPVHLEGNYRPVILIDGIPEAGGKGGADNALLSLMIPGWGDYYVSNPAKRKIKPWMVTTTSLGMMGLGLLSAVHRDTELEVNSYLYKTWVWDPQNHQHVYVNEIREYTVEKTDYFLFPYDAEIFIGVGAAVWLADIIYVLAKGSQNEKIRKTTFYNNLIGKTSIHYQEEGVMIRYTSRF